MSLTHDEEIKWLHHFVSKLNSLFDLYIYYIGETNEICVLSYNCLVDVYLCMRRASRSVKNAFVQTINMLSVLCNPVPVFFPSLCTACSRMRIMRVG